MSVSRPEFLLPEGVAFAGAQAALAAHLRLEAAASRSVDRTFYDTADGRLHARGLRLAREDGDLALFDASREVERARGADGSALKLMASDLPPGRLRDVLAPVIEMRALAPIARIRSRLLPLRVLDGEAKTVVRLLLEEPSLIGDGGRHLLLGSRLYLDGVRGYDAARKRVAQTLEQELGFAATAASVLDDAVKASGGVAGGFSSRLELFLRPDQRADSAATVLLVHLLGTIEQNLPGVLADVDTEFLHDLRVAVRRSRSAQRQLRGVFPPAPLAFFRGEFRWLQQVTGAMRDLDVHLLELDGLGSVLPEAQRGDLEPVRRLLQERRRAEQRRLVRTLRSQRLESLLAEWAVFLEELVSLPEEGRPDASRPIGAFAGERIGKVYRRIVNAGSLIDDGSPPERLHELRKSGKELRYLLEFFASLFPTEVVKPMVGTLKGLQDTLGRFYDREVQATTLRSLRDAVAAVEDGPAALMAMGLLVAAIEADQAAARSEFATRFAAFAAAPQRAIVRETFA
jgi:CHAD domain-containing protein